MYVIFVKGQPTFYNGRYLTFTLGQDPTIFTAYEAAMVALDNTFTVAKEPGHEQWAILEGDYYIARIVSVEYSREKINAAT